MSGGGGKTESKTVQELSPEQKQLLGLATPIFTNYLKSPPPIYSGEQIAPKNTYESLGQSLLLGATPNMASGAQSALQGSNFLSSGQVLDVNNNPALKGAIGAALSPITEAYQQNVLPGIRSESILNGMYGAPRQGIAEGQAANAYLRQVGDTTSGIINNAYNQGLDSMTKSLAFAPGIIQAQGAPAEAVSQIGSQERAYAQAQIDQAVQNYYNQQYLPYLLAQDVAGTAFGMPGGSAVSSMSGGGGPTTGSRLQGALGGAAAGASAGTMIFPGWGTAIGAGLGALAGAFMQ